MQKTKQSAHSVSSSIRPVTITSNFKHEKVEKLNQIVRNINEAKVEEGGVQQGTLVGDRVLEKLKERIKTNYDQLYTNYHHNKTKILKQIQTVESNIAGENHMQVRQEEVIREKARCDRLRARVEDLQKKLTRLNDLRGQLVSEVNAPTLEAPAGNQLRLADLDEKKEMIDHSYSVLEEMFRQRKAVELCLKARYTKLSAQLGRVRERAEKMAAQNQHKKLQIAKLTDQLERQQHIEIPSKLAQQLSSKIEQYQNKQAYAQILQNEAVLEQQRFQTMKAEVMKKREEQRQAKLKRQGQQKNAMEEMQVLYMIGQLEQEKLKRLCAVEEIRGVVQGDLELDGRSLEKVQSEIQAEIQKMTQENAVVQSEIQQIIAGKQQEGLPQQNIERLNLKLEEQTKKKKQLHSQYAKKSKLANEWLTLMHLINGNRVSKEAQSELLREIIGTKTKVASERSKMGGSSCASELFQAEDFK